LRAPGWDALEKSGGPQDSYDERIEIKDQQPEEPDEKRQDDERERREPGVKVDWNELREKQETDQVHGHAGHPRFRPVGFRASGVGAAQHGHEPEQRKIETRAARIEFVHRAGKIGVKANH
jgi:hypothetical protein